MEGVIYPGENKIMPARSHYDPETQARAVRMYADRLNEGDGVSKAQARREVSEVLGINEATLKNWIKRDLEARATHRQRSKNAIQSSPA